MSIKMKMKTAKEKRTRRTRSSPESKRSLWNLKASSREGQLLAKAFRRRKWEACM